MADQRVIRRIGRATLAVLTMLAGASNVPPPLMLPGPAKVSEDAKALCAAEYPDDFAMQGGCISNARSGARSFIQIARLHDDDPAWVRALVRCRLDYTLGQHVDWAMAGACARNQQRSRQLIER